MDWNLDDILRRIQTPKTSIQSSNRLLQDLINKEIVGAAEEALQDHSCSPKTNDNWNGALYSKYRHETELESQHRNGVGHQQGSCISSQFQTPAILTISNSPNPSDEFDHAIIPPPFEYQDSQRGNDQPPSLSTALLSPSMSPAFPDIKSSHYSPAYSSSVFSSTINEPLSPFPLFEFEQTKQPRNGFDRSPANPTFDHFPDTSYSPSFYNSPSATPTWNDKTSGSLRGTAVTRKVELSPRSPFNYFSKDPPTPSQTVYDDFVNDLENIQSFSPFNILLTSPDSVLESSLSKLIQYDNSKGNGLDQSIQNGNTISSSNVATSDRPVPLNLGNFFPGEKLLGFSEGVFTKHDHQPSRDPDFNLFQDHLFDSDSNKPPSISKTHESEPSLRDSTQLTLPSLKRAHPPPTSDCQDFGPLTSRFPEPTFQTPIFPLKKGKSNNSCIDPQEPAQLVRQSSTCEKPSSNEQLSGVDSSNSNQIGNSDSPSKVKLFKCSLCEKKFLDRSNLQLHSKIHMDPSDFECETCHSFFHTRYGLQVHKRNVHRHSSKNRESSLSHEKSKPATKCKKCLSVFRNKSELRQHQIEEHNKRPFACPKCTHRYRTDERLKQHILSHLTDEKSICPYCDKKLSSKSSLNRHLDGQKCDFLKELSH